MILSVAVISEHVLSVFGRGVFKFLKNEFCEIQLIDQLVLRTFDLEMGLFG